MSTLQNYFNSAECETLVTWFAKSTPTSKKVSAPKAENKNKAKPKARVIERKVSSQANTRTAWPERELMPEDGYWAKLIG